MIKLTLRHWRSIGVAATMGLAACGGEGGAERGAGGDGEAGEGAPVATPPTVTPPEAVAGGAAGGGEQGEAGAATAYAGLSGDQLTAMRIQHLRGFVMAASRVVADRGDPIDAAILVQQGMLEAYEPAPDQFGALDVAALRDAAAGTSLTREQMQALLRTAEDNLTRAMNGLAFDDAQLIVRMVDLSTGLYQQAVADGGVDPTEYKHSMGAALAAQQALTLRRDDLRRRNAGAYGRAAHELDRLVALFPSHEAPETPASYQQVLVQGSRVRLALSPYL